MIIRPEYLWPGLVVGLLLFNIGVSMTILHFASSDGGAQIVPDYYARSVDYDQELQNKRASAALDWSVEIVFEDQQAALDVVDDNHRPVDGLEGTITFYRPHRAEAEATVDIAASPDEAGRYYFANAADQPGLWDLQIEFEKSDLHYVERIRLTVER